MKRLAVLLCLAGALVWEGALAAPPADPESVVRAFNQAISKRDLTGAEKLMAKGAVQLTLRAAHAGVPGSPSGITSDLKTHWSTIGPVLFSVTSAYQRTVDQLVSQADGDLATVWAQVSTRTVERSGKQRDDRFSEVYLLVRVDGQWLIGAMGDNRGTDKMPVAAAAPATP